MPRKIKIDLSSNGRALLNFRLSEPRPCRQAVFSKLMKQTYGEDGVEELRNLIPGELSGQKKYELLVHCFREVYDRLPGIALDHLRGNLKRTQRELMSSAKKVAECLRSPEIYLSGIREQARNSVYDYDIEKAVVDKLTSTLKKIRKGSFENAMKVFREHRTDILCIYLDDIAKWIEWCDPCVIDDEFPYQIDGDNQGGIDGKEDLGRKIHTTACIMSMHIAWNRRVWRDGGRSVHKEFLKFVGKMLHPLFDADHYSGYGGLVRKAVRESGAAD